ncbi:MAG: PfkB family carbohydrate kinase [Fervidicoccaceae archaeon]
MNEKKMRVLVYGDLNIDLFFHLDLPEIELRDISYIADKFHMSPGGAAGNVGEALARLGLRPIIVSAIGLDIFGDLLLEDIISDGIETSYVKRIPHDTTGVMVILLRRDGRRTILGYRGANNYNVIKENELSNLIGEADYIYISGFASNNVDEGESIILLLKKAKSMDIRLGIDLGGVSRDFLKKLVDFQGVFTDIFLNKDELELLYGKSDEEYISRLAMELKPANIFLKMGSEGAIVYSEGKLMRVEAFDIGRPVDTTGCGDAFNAGTILGLSLGLSSYNRALIGNLMGAYKATGLGARHLPGSIDELREFALKKFPGRRISV